MPIVSNRPFEQPFEAPSPPGIAAQQPTHPSASGIEVVDTSIPSTVDPGETTTGTFTIELSVPSFGPGFSRPDYCSLGLTTIGFNILSGVTFAGASVGADLNAECLRTPSQADSLLGVTYSHQIAFEQVAPTTPGEYDIEIRLTGDDSGMIMDQEFVPIEVVGDGQDPPTDPDPDPDPDPPGSGGIWGRIIGLFREVVSTVDTGFETVADAIEATADFLLGALDRLVELLRSAGRGLREIVFGLFGLVKDNPLLLALLVIAVFGVAPALGESLVALTPVGVARELIPFTG